MAFKNSDSILIIAESQESAELIQKNLSVEKFQLLLESEVNTLNKNSQYDGIYYQTSKSDNSKILTELSSILKPGGTFILQEQKIQEREKEIFMNLTLAGFIDIKKGENTFFSIKPNWKIGTGQLLPKKRNQEAINTKPQPKVWSLNPSDITEEDLEDETKLLEEEDLKVPKKQNMDCETGPKKKACKNCSCGRVELELEAEKKGNQTNVQVKSSCGNCYLGDAFRCSTCPYLGKPAFKQGEELKLDVDVIDA